MSTLFRQNRALHGTHLSTGDRLGQSYLRPIAPLRTRRLVRGMMMVRQHDVIGTRCDPYTASFWRTMIIIAVLNR